MRARTIAHLWNSCVSQRISRLPLPQVAIHFSSVARDGNNGPHPTDEQKRKLNRLLYRSKQRGYLELDLLIGQWAQKNISSLNSTEIEALSQLLDEENPDLWKWLTGQAEAPPHTTSNPIFATIRSEVSSRLNAYSEPLTRAMPGSPWVRGWDDRDKKAPFGPPTGNQ